MIVIKTYGFISVGVLLALLTRTSFADNFGTGDNHFTIDFVTISGDASSANGTYIGDTYPGSGVAVEFADPGNDYRMGVFEITNDQRNKFQAAYGPVTGDPPNAYDGSAVWTGTNVPTNMVSRYEAAQFVNWLNTSTGHQAAYKFTGTQGTSDYALDLWSPSEADNGTNLYRHKDAFYYLPTEAEWVKAAYWNGTTLQTFATADDSSPLAGVDTNYDAPEPWDVGSGSEELNGTYDMMGNVAEMMENTGIPGDYRTDPPVVNRGGWYFPSIGYEYYFTSSYRPYFGYNYTEADGIGFRVASEVPEPSSAVLLSLGGIALLNRRRQA